MSQVKVNIELSHDVCVHADVFYPDAWNNLGRLKATIGVAIEKGATKVILGRDNIIEFYKTLSASEYRQEQIKALEAKLEELKAKDKEEGGE